MRALVPQLGRRTWRILAGVALFEVGSGLTLPLTIVYLHDVRGIDLQTAGLVLAARSVAGLAATPVAGALTDRVGAGRTAVLFLVLGAAGTGSLAAVHHAPGAFVASAALGASFAGVWIAILPLLTEAVPPSRRSDAFGANYAFTNLGLGVGGAFAALAVGGGSARAYELLFVVDSLSYLLFAALLLATGEARSPSRRREHASRGGYAAALSDRALLALTLLGTVMVAAGFGQLTAGYAAWTTGDAGSSARVVGAGFAANTLVIAGAQWLVLPLLRGHRRTRALAIAALLFGLSWVVVLAAGEARAGALTAAGLIAGPALFGLGETLFSPSLPGIVNDLAPERLRGRYNAVSSLSWSVGEIVGPALAGAMLERGLGAALLVGMALACAAGAPLAIGLERLLPPAVNWPAEDEAAVPV